MRAGLQPIMLRKGGSEAGVPNLICSVMIAVITPRTNIASANAAP